MNAKKVETENLSETMKLERIEVNLFRGTTADNSPGRIFGGQVEDLLAVLDGDHPPRGEAAAVAGAVDLEDDRHGRVARADEVAVQRVADAVFHRLIGRQQRLADHLAPKDPPRRIVRRRPAEEVHFDPLQLERLGQVFGFHRRRLPAPQASHKA